jgi:hypothetical protein
MPHVFALSGADSDRDRERKCKWVKNPRTGCSAKLCFIGKSAKHRTGWSFVESSCPAGRKPGRKRRKK